MRSGPGLQLSGSIPLAGFCDKKRTKKEMNETALVINEKKSGGLSLPTQGRVLRHRKVMDKTQGSMKHSAIADYL